MSGLRETTTDVDRINAELGAGRSEEQKAAWNRRCDEFRNGSRMLFHIELSTVARFDNWTDEEAALLLAGIPLSRRDAVSDPAYEIQLGLARHVLCLIDSGSTERRPPSTWIEWADSKQVPVPNMLRDALAIGFSTDGLANYRKHPSVERFALLLMRATKDDGQLLTNEQIASRVPEVIPGPSGSRALAIARAIRTLVEQ